MRRAALLAVTAAASTVFAVQPGAAAPARLDLTEAGGAQFPERAFVISLPSERAGLTASDVRVTENGNAVVDETVVPASAAGKQTSFGVALVVDTSESMAGKPLAAAMAAARAFAAHRNPNQKLALVTFDGAPHVVLPLTASTSKIDAALSQVPSVAYGTHIYDAVSEAEALLQTSKIDAGSIVVLSDGADTGSVHTAPTVSGVAKLHGIKLFTVGLRSKHFDPTTLVQLAALGNGEYAAADKPAALRPLFDQLGSRLAREYLVRYKSLVGPNAPVRVAVSLAGGGTGSAAYRTPALPVSVPPPYHQSLETRIWGSWIVILVLALFAAVAVAVLAVGLLQPRRSTLPARMSEFVSIPSLQTHERRQPHGAAVAAAGAAGADAPHPGFWAELDEKLEIARINVSAPALVGGTVVATVLLALILDAAFGSFWFALLALLLPFAVREWVLRKLARRRNQFAEQLPDALQVISSALRAGHSFAGALAVVVESSSEPMKSEMQQVVADEQRGIALERAIAVVVKRMENRDLEQVALVALLQRDAGGNAAEVVDRVAETIRERFELRRLVSTLTVQGRMSRWIVSALPIALVLVLLLINPHYMHPLVSHTAGRVMLVLAGLSVLAGSYVIKKIVDIKV